MAFSVRVDVIVSVGVGASMIVYNYGISEGVFCNVGISVNDYVSVAVGISVSGRVRICIGISVNVQFLVYVSVSDRVLRYTRLPSTCQCFERAARSYPS